MDGLLAEIPYTLFMEWFQFWKMSPFGDEWQRSALMPTVYANANRKKGSRAVQMRDFMPCKEPKAQQTPEEMLGIVKAAFFDDPPPARAAAAGGEEGKP